MAVLKGLGFFKKLFGRKKKTEEEIPEVAEAAEQAAEAPAKPKPAKKPKAKKAEPEKAKKAEPEKPKKAEPEKPKKAEPVKAKKAAPKKAEPEKPKKAEPKPAPEPEVKAEPQPAPEPQPVPEPTPVPAPEPAPVEAEQPAPEEKPNKAEPEKLEKAEPEKLEKAEPEKLEKAEPEKLEKAEPETPKKKGWFSKLKDGLTRSSTALTENITSIFTKRKLDADTLQELEDILIQADLGIDTAMRITETIARDRYDKEVSPDEVRAFLAAEVEAVLQPVAQPLEVPDQNQPYVILVVGVNGTGKTTTIGKLASNLKQQGKSVMLAAGDTFRAAAIEQLVIWGERADVPVISSEVGADAAGLAFDALVEARAAQSDVLIVDTAGRLQNKADLMAELEKVIRVIKKQDDQAPHAVLLVLDATTGQNALNQVEIFQKVAGVTGLVVTKLDGTARGGILVAIADRFGLPVHAIGVGEGIDDMQPFNATDFALAIAGHAEDHEQAA